MQIIHLTVAIHSRTSGCRKRTEGETKWLHFTDSILTFVFLYENGGIFHSNFIEICSK